MYRIHFEPHGAYWCIQFASYFCGLLIWKTVKVANGLKKVIKEFDDYESAKSFVEDQGISKMYKEWEKENSSFLEVINSPNRRDCYIPDERQPLFIPKGYKLVPEMN
jgi:hypothetical protein